MGFRSTTRLFHVPPFFTTTNAEFVKYLNSITRGELGHKVFYYDPMTRCVTVHVPPNHVVFVTDHLAHILGFKKKTYFADTRTTADYIMDPFGDVYSV